MHWLSIGRCFHSGRGFSFLNYNERKMQKDRLKTMRKYFIPAVATVGMLIFAFVYEPPTPLWWVIATVIILFGYGYSHAYYHK
jgi:drug/metabolite transporter (DMT)-like permease